MNLKSSVKAVAILIFDSLSLPLPLSLPFFFMIILRIEDEDGVRGRVKEDFGKIGLNSNISHALAMTSSNPKETSPPTKTELLLVEYK